MTDHLAFDQLNDLADGTADATSVRSAREHLAACASCAEQVTALRALSAETSRLPREIAPPPELWTSIRAGLAPRTTRAFRWTTGRRLAAAGLLVAASSSILTMLALRAKDRMLERTAVAVAPSAAPASAPSSGALPARVASAERGYARDVDALRRTLDERRDSLAPSTVATVERSLRIADSAIAEARAALARDPANGVLASLFLSNYERKIDLLRRATELAPRT
jgi:hypothetical protein